MLRRPQLPNRQEANFITQGQTNVIIRPLLAFPIIIYFWKVLVVDKVLGLGSADPLTGMVADWAGMIITAYVGRTVYRESCANFQAVDRPSTQTMRGSKKSMSGEMAHPDNLGPRFDPTINYGHILTIVSFIAAGAGACYGMRAELQMLISVWRKPRVPFSSLPTWSC